MVGPPNWADDSLSGYRKEKRTPARIRKLAVIMARDLAKEREQCGDPEGAEAVRILARDIERIGLTE